MRSLRSFAVIIAIATQWACDASRGSVAPPPTLDVAVAELTTASSVASVAPVGSTLSAIRIRVGNKVGLPVRGVPVTFGITRGGGSVTPTSATSDSLGAVTVSWTLGPSAGLQVMQAIVGELALTIATTAMPSGAARLLRVAGDSQTAVVNTPVAVGPAVKLVDASGNPVAEMDVTFTIPSANGSVVNATVRTGPDGVARSGGWTLATSAGDNVLEASAGGPLFTTFTARGVPGAATGIVVTSDVTRELFVGDAFSVKAKAYDRFGNENSATQLKFSVVPTAAGTIDDAGVVSTLAAGPLTVSAIATGSTAGGGAQGQYATSVTGHPTGPTIAARLFVGVDPSSVAVTDEGIFAVSPTGRTGLITRLSLDGSVQFPSVEIETPSLNFLIAAPKRGGGTALIVNSDAITSTYWFLDVAKNRIVSSFTTLRYAKSAVMSADGKRAYVLLDAGELAVIDMTTYRMLQSIPLGGNISRFRPAPGDTLAYAQSTIGTMLEIDLMRGVVRRQFAFPSYADMEPSRDLTHYFVIDRDAQIMRVIRSSDLAEQRVYGTSASTVSVAPDTKAFFLASNDRVEVAVGDIASGLYPGPVFITSGPPARVLFSTDGSVAIVPTTNGWIDIIR